MKLLSICILTVFWSTLSFSREQVSIFGLKRMNSNFIQRELNIDPDKPASDSLLMAETTWLWRLGLFRKVEFLKPDQDPDALLLTVEEKSPWSFVPLLVYDRLFGWYGGLETTCTGLWGGNESVAVSAEIGGLERFILAFDRPPLGACRYFFHADVSQIRFDNRYPDHPEFRERDQIVSANLGRAFGRTVRLGLLGLWERVWTDAPFARLSPEDDIITGWGLKTSWDTRDWPDYPTRGGLLDIQWIRRNLPKGRMDRATMDCRWAFPIGKHVLALGSVAHLSDGTIPVYRRIHLGGHDQLRGFRSGTVPGESSFWLTAEYRIPWLYIRDPVAGVHVGYAFTIFADAGQAWYGKTGPNWEGFRGSAGIGGYAIWDTYVLRAELGVCGDGLFVTTGTSLKF